MDIILVSNRFEQARSFRLSKPQIFFLGLLFLLLVVSLAVLLNYFSLRYAVTHKSPYLQSVLASVQEEQTRRTQTYVRESLNTMAARVGEMQAKLLRLDTLGERLTKLAGLDPKEFMFEQTPARGGPSPELESKPLSYSELTDQLDALAGDLDDPQFLSGRNQLVLIKFWLAYRSVYRFEDISRRHRFHVADRSPHPRGGSRGGGLCGQAPAIWKSRRNRSR